MPREPNERRSPTQPRARATVRAIVRASADVVAREGLERATTNRIAARAGVSIGSLYHYFADKDAILDALAETAIESTVAHVVAQSRELLEGSTVERSMRPLLAMAVDWVRANEVVARAVFEARPNADHARILRTVEDRVVDAARTLDAGDLGALREALGPRFDVLIRLFLTMGSAAVYRIALHTPDEPTREAMLDELARMSSAFRA